MDSSTVKPPATAPKKPKIDPLQLLKCLSILLNQNGGILGNTEAARVKGLMMKYSKKLVSRCIYLNILEATDLNVLDAFYEGGGWELVYSWLVEANTNGNWPLAHQILTLLENSPMSVRRLKKCPTPRLVKELSKSCSSPDVQSLAKRLVLKWMDVVRQGDNASTADGVGLSNASASTEDSPSEAEANKDQAGTSTGTLGSADSSANDGSSSMEGQDESSNTSTESDKASGPVTPIRITIRSGSQVLAKVSSQRVSLDSNDSDDNKPLSVLKKEVEKKRQNSSEETSDDKSEDETQPENDKSLANDVETVKDNSASAANTSSANTVPNSDENLSKSDDVDATSNGTPENVDGTTTTPTSATVSAVHTVVTFSGNQTATESSAEADSVTPMETDAEDAKGTEKSDDTEVKDTKESNAKRKEGSEEEKSKEGSEDGKSKEGSEDGKSKEGSEDGKSKEGSEDDEKKIEEKDSKKKIDSDVKNDKSNKDKGKDRSSDKKDKEREKDRKSRDDKKKDKDKESSRSSKSRSDDKSRSDKDKHSKDHDKSRSDKSSSRKSSSSSSKSSSSRSSSSRDKDRDRDKNRKDGDRRTSSSSSRDKDRKKEDPEAKKKEQEKEDKDTLEKVKPLSADGLRKIPRKSTPASFLDALGSADDGSEAKKPSVKTYKSRGFRNTGLLDEPTKPPTAKKVGTDKKGPPGSIIPGTKRFLDDLPITPDKRSKISSVSSSPLQGDKPGGVKLISPKRPSLSDDGGFMAALTASGGETRKKVTRKRKSSESDKSDGQSSKEDDKGDEKSPTNSPVKTEEKPVGMLSPTSVKPTFNFYQETLKDEAEKSEEKEDSSEEKEGTENGDVEMKDETKSEGEGEEKPAEATQSNEDDNMDIEESEDQEIQIGIGASSFGDSINGGGGAGIKEEEIPLAPAVPAPCQEEYEKVEVTFSQPKLGLKGVLSYHRPENRKKKSVKWRAEEDLQQVFFFELDETERVNVNTIKFNEMMALDKQREREAMGKNRGMHGNMMMPGNNNHMMGMQQNVIEYMRWSLLPIMIPTPSTVSPGYKSQERIIQATRESSTMAAFYHPAMLPDTPREPDPEMVPRAEPKQIPVSDISGQDIIHDHRNKMWPEPVIMEPMNFNYGGMGGGGPPHHHPPGGGVNDGGSHWVVGGPPAGFPGPGGPGPMYAGPGPGGFGGPGMGGPGMGGPGMGGPPGNFGNDMGGPGMDVHGWGGGPGPGMDYPPNQNMMMMGGGNQGMMMPGGGGGGRQGGGPGGMMHNNMPPMRGGRGRQNFRGRNGPRGGDWGPPGSENYSNIACKHFMYGRCRHGKKCHFSHDRE